MANMTDPARELGEIAQRLAKGTSQKGAAFLAGEFGVDPWSTQFYRIIACILERCDEVQKIVQASAMDDDHKRAAVDELEGLKLAFGVNALINSWNTAGHGLTHLKEHGRAMQFLSPVVRAHTAYPTLSPDESEELAGLIDQYLANLDDGIDPPFVRQAIVDGLSRFRFQLCHLDWMGAGYALSAFRELALVYEAALRRQDVDDLDAGAALAGLLGILQQFKARVEQAKGWADAGGAVWQVIQIGSSFTTGLALGNSPGG